MVDYMDTHPQCGIAGATMMDPDDGDTLKSSAYYPGYEILQSSNTESHLLCSQQQDLWI